MAVDSAGRIELVALQESWYADVQRFDGGLLILDPAGKIVDSAPRRSEIAGRQASALIYGAANIANEGSGQDSRDPLSLASGEAHSRLESRPETEGGN
jgi:hypothetical protein